MHRIFLAYDGSSGSDEACRLIASLHWQEGTKAQVITALPTDRELRRGLGHLLLAVADDVSSRLHIEARTALEAPAQMLSEAGLEVGKVIVRGRPAQALAAAASRFEATIVVVGSRGHGPVASTFLGSVSAELVDIAPAPVLIARSAAIHRVVLGADGSSHALDAEALLGTLPLGDAAVRVVSVVDVVLPWIIGIAPTTYLPALDVQVDYEAEARGSAQRVVDESAARLREAGIRAAGEVHVGDPGWELIRSADALEADLVVVGSRGQTGFHRFIVGSVARKVVHHAKASVLVVRAGTYEAQIGDGEVLDSEMQTDTDAAAVLASGPDER